MKLTDSELTEILLVLEEKIFLYQTYMNDFAEKQLLVLGNICSKIKKERINRESKKMRKIRETYPLASDEELEYSFNHS